MPNLAESSLVREERPILGFLASSREVPESLPVSERSIKGIDSLVGVVPRRKLPWLVESISLRFVVDLIVVLVVIVLLLPHSLHVSPPHIEVHLWA